MPDQADRAAHDVAVTALSSDPSRAGEALARLREIEEARRARGEAPTGLVGIAEHTVHATLDDPRAYAEARRDLLGRSDLDPGLRRRLEQERADDPLRLAEHRLRDARLAGTARYFNALVEPLANAAFHTTLAPYHLARALLGLGAARRSEESISVPERQALAHWKRYIEAHPDTPEAARLVQRVQSLQARWTRMKRDRYLRVARGALERNQPALALVLADSALRYAPEDREASRLRNRAEARFETQRTNRRRSLMAPEAPPPDASDRDARALARALLVPGGNPAQAAEPVLSHDPESSLSDEARFAIAIALGEANREGAMWEELRRLAERDPKRVSMGRHAAALLASPLQNPFAAFSAARAHDRRRRGGWLLLGPLARGPRDWGLPGPLEWLIEVPTLVPAIGGLPNRLVRAPWLPPTATVAAAHARHYLARFPTGEHAAQVRGWLIDFEASRGNWIEAHRVASAGEDFDPERLFELRDRAARQGLEFARRQRRGDLRLGLLRHTARTYPQTEAGREAGRQAREALEDASLQRIRISRGFLQENPPVAGPEGLGLRPELLDGDRGNGELHPDGVFLLGGRTLEFALVDEGEDEEAPPRRVRRSVSAERLARLVALLDETELRNALVDPDATTKPDAGRDLYFERARLGVTNEPDPRPTARSTYAFLGMRERYGMVRSRESILPVEIVLQGSFDDLSLSAFPRIRPPKPTPDAVLYK